MGKISKRLADSDVGPDAASQVEAEAGTETGLRAWTPARIKQAIVALGGAIYAAISHAHAGADIASGSVDGDRLPALSTGKKGGVPATGTVSSTKYLRDDGTWNTPPGGGGDVTGPAGATAGHVAILDGTGKVLSDGGQAPADFAAADHDATHAPGGSDALPWTTAHGRGTTVAKPAAAASNAGYLYYDTDLAKLQRSTGSAWEDCAETAGAPAAHAASHTNGGDDIQTATASQKGVMSSAAMTKLDGIEAAADVTDAANIEDAITGSAEETTPATGWKLPVVVSAALKWINWSNIASLFTPAAHAGAAVGSSHTGVGTAAAAATGDFATAAQGTLATNAVPKGTYTTDGGIVVATGAGTYQEETGTTLLASLVAAGAVSAASTNTLTNKTLDSLTNVISADRIHRKIYAGEAIAKGDLVYVSTWNDVNACPEVRKARANAIATMPCIGIADVAISASEVGEVYSAGVVTGLVTTGFSAGTKLYVSSSTAGAWTSTRPVGPNIEQKWGVVGYEHATAGTVSVYLGSTHEFSAADKFWYGGTGGLVTEGSITAAGRAILDDANAAAQLTTLGAVPGATFTQDSGILVGTGAGTYQEETGATLRTSIGVGVIGTLATVKRCLTFDFDGGGAALTTATKAILPYLPAAFTPTRWSVQCSVNARTGAAGNASVAMTVTVGNFSTSAFPAGATGGTQPSVTTAAGATAAANFTDTEWAAGQGVMVELTGTPTALWATLIIEGTSVA
jgi:hypothetical protein